MNLFHCIYISQLIIPYLQRKGYRKASSNQSVTCICKTIIYFRSDGGFAQASTKIHQVGSSRLKTLILHLNFHYYILGQENDLGRKFEKYGLLKRPRKYIQLAIIRLHCERETRKNDTEFSVKIHDMNRTGKEGD